MIPCCRARCLASWRWKKLRSNRGLIISLDGLDGTGKSAQCRLLAAWLQARGHAVTACADPGGTAIGEIVRQLLLDRRQEMTVACEALLFMANRAQLTSEIIRPALEAGRVVISDRFLLANVVYQGHAGGLDPDLLWGIGRMATGGLEPDVTLILDLPVDVAMARRRGSEDRFESRDAAYQARVREGFLTEARRHPDRLRVIDANQPLDVVQERIAQEVARVLAASSRA
jgi:dTMP kinase